MNDLPSFSTMDERKHYLFDLQNFLVVKSFLSNTEITALNPAIDANQHKCNDHVGGGEGPDLIVATVADSTKALTWEPPCCQGFRSLLAHRQLVPYLNTSFGRGWKLDHSPNIITATQSVEGLNLHGHGNVQFNPSPFCAYHKVRMRCGLLNCQFYLSDMSPNRTGDLCIIPGSHKANYACPRDILLFTADR